MTAESQTPLSELLPNYKRGKTMTPQEREAFHKQIVQEILAGDMSKGPDTKIPLEPQTKTQII